MPPAQQAAYRTTSNITIRYGTSVGIDRVVDTGIVHPPKQICLGKRYEPRDPVTGTTFRKDIPTSSPPRAPLLSAGPQSSLTRGQHQVLADYRKMPAPVAYACETRCFLIRFTCNLSATSCVGRRQVGFQLY